MKRNIWTERSGKGLGIKESEGMGMIKDQKGWR